MNNIRYKYDIENLNKRLKEIRILRKETQQSLAEKINVQRQAIINWEKDEGYSVPSLDRLVDLCNVLDCSVDYLLGSVDTPEIESITKASHYSTISPEIIRYTCDNSEFRDFLNFIMNPQNISHIFNPMKLNLWKKHWIDSSLKDIDVELADKLIEYYDEYISVNPYYSIDKRTYAEFLIKKFPIESISFSIPMSTYQTFFNNKDFNYMSFINYLVEHSYDSLSHKMMLEIQINKLANEFVDLFTKYLDEE